MNSFFIPAPSPFFPTFYARFVVSPTQLYFMTTIKRAEGIEAVEGCDLGYDQVRAVSQHGM